MPNSSRNDGERGGNHSAAPAIHDAINPTRIVGVGIATTILYLVLLGSVAWGIHRIHAAEKRLGELQKAVVDVASLDGVMSRSAQMAVSGDMEWQVYHGQAADAIRRYLEQVAELAGVVGMEAVAERLVEAEARLEDTEREVFARARRGEQAAALQRLSTREYSELKEVLTTSLQQVDSAVTPALRSRHGSFQRIMLLGAASAIAATLALIAMWLRVLLLLRRCLRERDCSQAKLNSLARSISDVVAVLDANGRHVDIAPTSASLLYQSREELIGKTLHEILPADAADFLLGYVHRALTTGQPEYVEYSIPTGDRVVWYSAAISRISGDRVVWVARDVSRRKEAENELESQRAFLRAVIDTNRNLIFVKDRNGRYTLANRTVAEAYGTTPEALVGRTDADFNPDPAQVEEFLHEDREVIDSGTELLIPDQSFTDPQTGELRWYHTRKVPLLPPGGGPVQVLCIASDVTERKRAEAERAAAEAHYRRLVTTSPQAIYVLDVEGCVVEVNPALERLLDYSSEFVLGRHFSDFIAADDLHQAVDAFTMMITGRREEISMEIRLVRRSGEQCLTTVKAAAVVVDGSISGVHGIIHDITQERAQEERARFLALVLDSLSDGVLVTNSKREVVYANSAGPRILGVEPAMLGNLTTDDFLPDGAAREEIETIEEVLHQSGQWSGRIWRRRLSDGRIVPLDAITNLVTSGERSAEKYVFSIFHDASVEVQIERHLRRTERLASLGTLLRGVAHELNNPLHAIRNFADLMLMDERSQDDREALRFVRQEADRAAQVVADMYRFARQAEDNEEGGRSAVHLNDAVREALTLHHYALRTGEVELKEELAAELPPIQANKSEVEQVILSLLTNAEHALGDREGGKKLIVRTCPSALGAAVEVIDSGCGIPPQHLETIFDPFWTTKAPGEGRGLGLSVAHSIVTDHGGRITVDSRPEQGTKVTVEFPLAVPEHPWELRD